MTSYTPYSSGSIHTRNFFEPHKGHTLTEEMQCYSLPYGGLGFVSHLLTYHTVSVLSAGRSPIRPWKRLYNSKINLWLCSIGFVGGFALGTFTLVRCRNHWQLLVIGIWKLSMSFFNGVVGVHVALIMRKVPKPEKIKDVSSSSSYLPLAGYDEEKASQKSGRSGTAASSAIGSYHETIIKQTEEKAKTLRPSTGYVWFWVLLYIPGMIAGFCGLTSLIIQNWHPATHPHNKSPPHNNLRFLLHPPLLPHPRGPSIMRWGRALRCFLLVFGVRYPGCLVWGLGARSYGG